MTFYKDMRGWYRHPKSPKFDHKNPFIARIENSDYTPSSDSRLIYVSATGNDLTANQTNIAAQSNALDPQGTIKPYLTIGAAAAQLRSGFSDWLILKRGDTWTDQPIPSSTRSGRSPTEPMVTGCYGTGERPILECGRSDGIRFTGKDASYQRIHGIDFYAHTRDPAHPGYVASPVGGHGIRWFGGGTSLVVDDCKVRYFGINASFEPSGGGVISDITLKKNIITDSYKSHAEGHSQGLFIANIDGILIEDNVFDHNGWNELIASATETQFNHNVYLHEYNSNGNNITFRRNISTGAAATGCHGRPGGTYFDNFFSGNSIGLGLGFWNVPLAKGVAAKAEKNVILDGKLQKPGEKSTTAVWGLTVRSDIINSGGSATLTDNIIANRRDSGSNVGMDIVSGVTYNDNVVYKWNASEDMTNPAWLDPKRSAASYMSSIGETATFQAFINKARNRNVGEWDTKYIAPTINDYIRAGFNK